MRLVIRGRSGDDPVEIVRELLRFLQTLPPAGGTAVPIGIARSGTVEVLDDGFGSNRHFVDGAVGEIGELFRMSKREAGAATLMARVGARGRESALHRFS